MNCEMCGKGTELCTASVEGVVMKVCSKCSGHGKIIRRPQPRIIPRRINRPTLSSVSEPEVELVEAVVEDYAKKIRDARSKAGLTQKEFAKKINEKESLLHKMETGSFKPSMPTAKKLEKILQIKLVEQREEEKLKMPASKSAGGAMTIGDMIKN
jgi:putative transcription factor